MIAPFRHASYMAVALVCAATAVAQDLKIASPSIRVIQPPALKALINTNRVRVTLNILKNGTVAGPADEKALSDYYGAHIALFNVPENLTALPRIRADIRRDLLTASKAPMKAAHTWMTTFLLKESQALAADEKSTMPARVNGLLLLAYLNATEATDRTDAVPHPGALAALSKIYADAKTPPGLRVVALKGLVRHANMGIADKAVAAKAQAEMLATLKNKTVPKNVSPEAHEWFRRLATSALGGLGAPGASAGEIDVLEAVFDVLAEENASIGFRADAVRNLGRFDYKNAGSINHPLMAHRVGSFLADILAPPKDVSKEKVIRDGGTILHYIECARTALNGAGTQPGGIAAAAGGDNFVA